jgi:ABC-type multidrug transport system fused ATPase/permease subunit
LKNFKKIYFLIGKKFSKKLLVLSVFLIFGMLFEIIGLGLLIPLLQMISDPDFFSNPTVSSILNRIELREDHFFYVLLGITLLTNLVKTLLLILLNYKQLKILNDLNTYLSVKLFANFLNRSQESFQKQNSALMQKKINTDTNHFLVYCSAHISIIVEISILMSIVLTVAYINPYSVLITFSILALLSAIFFRFTKTNILKWGNQRDLYEEKINLDVIEGLRAYKEISIYNASTFFINKFNNHKSKVSLLNSRVQTLNVLPRYFLEFMSIFGVIVFLFFMVSLNQSLSELISFLGLLIAALLKSLPSANKIMASLQNIKYYSSSVNSINTSLEESTNNTEKFNSNIEFDFNRDLILKNISFKYQSSDAFVIKNLNLKIKQGSSIGIVGPSGSGKSTFVDLLVGLLRPSEGVIQIGDRNINDNIVLWKKSIGYVSQEIFLTDRTISENIAFGLKKDQVNSLKLINAINNSELQEFINNLPNKEETKAGEAGAKMSGGQRQRIGLARAMYKDSKILILDEATSALDSKTEKMVLNSIFKNKEKTKIIISHKLSSLRFCDQVYEFKDGSLILKKQ